MTLNCKGELVDLEQPKVMGILNITPDSFYDGGKYGKPIDVLKQTEKMLKSGATFIDVGAYSTRPGAKDITVNEELERLIPIVELLVEEFPEILLSIDTFRSIVADKAIENGAAIINDISAGLLDPGMMDVIAKHHVPYIMMHMKGNPRTMQEQTEYNNLISDLLLYFSERLFSAKSKGISDIILDPGFGFSKTMNQNYELLKKLELLQLAEKPILVGVSRKSMIYRLLDTNPENALNGTTAINMLALEKGAKILRVHDVAEAIECVKIYEQLTA